MTSVRPACASSMNSTAATTARTTPSAVRIDRGWTTTTTRPWAAPPSGGPGPGGRTVSGDVGSCSVTLRGVPRRPATHRVVTTALGRLRTSCTAARAPLDPRCTALGRCSPLMNRSARCAFTCRAQTSTHQPADTLSSIRREQSRPECSCTRERLEGMSNQTCVLPARMPQRVTKASTIGSPRPRGPSVTALRGS
jgi:hypothetical protein